MFHAFVTPMGDLAPSKWRQRSGWAGRSRKEVEKGTGGEEGGETVASK